MIEDTLIILGFLFIGFVCLKQRIDHLNDRIREISLVLDDIDEAFREAGTEPFYEETDDEDEDGKHYTVRVFSKDELRKKK